MNTIIESNELIDSKRVSVVRTQGNFIDDLQELQKAIVNYTSAYSTYQNIPSEAPHKEQHGELVNKMKAELNLRMAYVEVYKVEGAII